jgi:hypothetical protein
MINIVTKFKIIHQKDIIYLAENEMKGPAWLPFFLKGPRIKSASCEQRNKQGRREIQLVPKGMPAVC